MKQPFEFLVPADTADSAAGETVWHVDAVEEACWQSFLSHAANTETTQWSEYVFVRTYHRCDHFLFGEAVNAVCMALIHLDRDHVRLHFEHLNRGGGLIARCDRTISCRRRFGRRTLLTDWPEDLSAKLAELPPAQPIPQGTLATLFRKIIGLTAGRRL